MSATLNFAMFHQRSQKRRPCTPRSFLTRLQCGCLVTWWTRTCWHFLCLLVLALFFTFFNGQLVDSAEGEERLVLWMRSQVLATFLCRFPLGFLSVSSNITRLRDESNLIYNFVFSLYSLTMTTAMELIGRSSLLKSPGRDTKKLKRPISNCWKCSGRDLLERLVLNYDFLLFIFDTLIFNLRVNISSQLDQPTR